VGVPCTATPATAGAKMLYRTKTVYHESFLIKEGGLHYIGGAYIKILSEMEQTWHTSSKDADEAEMKKKFKNFDCAPSYSIYVRIMEILVFIFFI
jgi:hypothetical protein